MKTIDARFPWALYLPMATVTAGGGLLIVLSGHGTQDEAALEALPEVLAARLGSPAPGKERG